MTLFVSMPGRRYGISDAYVMGLTFIIVFSVGKQVIKKRANAKEIPFSEFKKTDPVLSQFKDLTEPDVQQKPCLINDLHDIIDIKTAA